MVGYPTAWTAHALIGLLLAGSFAGCLGSTAKDQNGISTATPSGSARATGTSASAGPNGTSPASTYEDPVADFYALPNPGFAAQNVTLNATNANDPAGGNLSYIWHFGDSSGSTTGPVVNHVYATPGTYAITLRVTSDRSHQWNTAGINLSILDPASVRAPLPFSDPAGDAVANAAAPSAASLDYADILSGSMFLESNGNLRVVVALKKLPPSYTTFSALMLGISVNGTRYDVTGFAGSATVVRADGGPVQGASAELDATDNAITVRLPTAAIQAVAPFHVSVEMNAGEPNQLHGKVPLDRAPNTGDYTYNG